MYPATESATAGQAIIKVPVLDVGTLPSRPRNWPECPSGIANRTRRLFLCGHAFALAKRQIIVCEACYLLLAEGGGDVAHDAVRVVVS